MFCRFFIMRPVLSMVISIIIILAGLVAMLVSPIEQYPNIVPPVLNISANFPGANSETIANAVAAPIEDQMSGVPGMIYMQSSSMNGSSQMALNVYFETGTNLELVEADALNRINTAMPQLPVQVQNQGIVMRMKNPDLFMVIPFYSDSGYPSKLYISNYVQRYIYPIVEQIAGVGVVSIFGQRQYAMRALLDPNKLAYYKIGVKDIIDAINDQNYPYVVGMNAMEPMAGKQKFNFMINAPGYFTEESQFQNIVVRANEKNAQIVKLKDLSTQVKLDAEQYYTYMYIYLKQPDGSVIKREATSIGIYLIPGANQLQVRKEVKRVLEDAAKHMPSGIKYYYHYDSSEFVLLSVEAVVNTLITAFILVFFVVMLFIQNIRGTIIPVLAIPVAIIGAFAGTYALGFSINTLTLFGMVLAIGIVVDDAIVVLENVERLMTEEGLSSADAAIKAMEEVAAPVIAIVLVLNAVFVPVAFLGGFSGVLMQQFAVTISVSVLLSGIVALTLTPTLCAIFLRNLHKKSQAPTAQFIGTIWLNKFYAKFNWSFDKLRDGYMYLVTILMDNARTALLIWSGVLATVVFLFVKVIPVGLIPLEDMSYYYNTMHVVSAGSMDYTLDQADKLSRDLMKLPALQRLAIMGGVDVVDNSSIKTNTATFSVILKDYALRTAANEQINPVIAASNKIDAEHKEVTAMAFNQPPIRGMSPTGGVTFYLQATRPITVEQVKADSDKLVKYLRDNYPKIVGSAAQFYNVTTPEINIEVDAQRAYMYGVSYQEIFNTMQAIFGNYYVNYFTKWEDLWWTILQADYRFRSKPDLLNVIYVKAKTGAMIPVGSLINYHYKTGAEVVTRLNDFLASQIVVNPNLHTGASSGQVMNAIVEATPKVLGEIYAVKWFGPSYQQALAGAQSEIAFGLGVIMVFLILAALFELWSLPIAVLMGLPFSLLAAGITLVLFNKPNDIYFQVSLLTLVGLSAKNAILIIEFAIEGVRQEALSYRDAALHAARLRFRPIIMTSIAFILGAVPLVTATGAGANSQHSVGLGIIGGMLGSTCVATFFIPTFFVLVMQWSEKNKRNN